MKLGPKRIIRVGHSAYEPGSGNLATLTQTFVDGKSRWTVGPFESCREAFHNRFSWNQENILVRNPDKETEGIANFIWRIESALETVKKTRIGRTNRAGYTWFHVSPFWLRHPMRRSFFTAAIRAGRSYKQKDNFEEALFSVRYFNATSPVRKATKRFLAGFTWYTGNLIGWLNAFYAVTDEQLEKLLIRPPKPIPLPF